jgi:epsilon-lactone hydrolase
LTLSLTPERLGKPAPPDLAERRAQMTAGLAAGVWATARPPVETKSGGQRTLRFASRIPPRGHIIHFHGGGYRLGCPEIAGPFASRLAEQCRVEVVCPQYRLSPEHPFPAGVNDAWAALEALRAESGDAPLIVSGDSAGGGLAVAVAVLAVERGLRLNGLVLISAWLDQTVSAASFAANAASDPMFSRESARLASKLYLQGSDPLHPLASPLRAPLTGLPPVLVSVGAGEVLADDARGFHARLRAAGVASELIEIPGMEHVAVTRGADLPGSAETFAAIARFVDRIVGASA